VGRISGRNARLYVAITSGGSAESIAFLDKYNIDFSSPPIDVTAFGDSNKVYVAGLPDAKGAYSGFYDTATAQLLTAAQDGVARKAYLYTDLVGTPGQYWYGTALFDFGADFSVSGAAGVKGSFSAASAFLKVG
jgi:hypothetical protein